MPGRLRGTVINNWSRKRVIPIGTLLYGTKETFCSSGRKAKSVAGRENSASISLRNNVYSIGAIGPVCEHNKGEGKLTCSRKVVETYLLPLKSDFQFILSPIRSRRRGWRSGAVSSTWAQPNNNNADDKNQMNSRLSPLHYQHKESYSLIKWLYTNYGKTTA